MRAMIRQVKHGEGELVLGVRAPLYRPVEARDEPRQPVMVGCGEPAVASRAAWRAHCPHLRQPTKYLMVLLDSVALGSASYIHTQNEQSSSNL